jgi:hypothetical protein
MHKAWCYVLASESPADVGGAATFDGVGAQRGGSTAGEHFITVKCSNVCVLV